MSTEIEIKPNNCITNDPCALCGARCDPTGTDPFVAGTWALVCDECVEAHGLTDQLAAARNPTIHQPTGGNSMSTPERRALEQAAIRRFAWHEARARIAELVTAGRLIALDANRFRWAEADRDGIDGRLEPGEPDGAAPRQAA